MDVKIRDLGDAVNQLTTIENNLIDLESLLSFQRKAVTASVKNKLKVVAESIKFSFKKSQVTPSNTIDLNSAKELKVSKGLENLISSYALMEIVLDLKSQVKGIETAVRLQFADNNNIESVLAKVEGINTKIQVLQRNITCFLHEISKNGIPPAFNKFIFSVAELLSKKFVINNEKCKVSYMLCSYNGCLLYTAYIELRGLERSVQDHVEVIPSTYFVISWLPSCYMNVVDIRIGITYEWEPPAELYAQSTIKATSTTDVVAALSAMIANEDLVVSNTRENTEELTMYGNITQMDVDPFCIVVHTASSLKNSKLRTLIYMKVPKLFGTGAKYDVSVSKNKMTFNLLSRGDMRTYTDDDIAEFKSWGIAYEQIKKIETILMS